MFLTWPKSKQFFFLSLLESKYLALNFIKLFAVVFIPLLQTLEGFIWKSCNQMKRAHFETMKRLNLKIQIYSVKRSGYYGNCCIKRWMCHLGVTKHFLKNPRATFLLQRADGYNVHFHFSFNVHSADTMFILLKYFVLVDAKNYI